MLSLLLCSAAVSSGGVFGAYGPGAGGPGGAAKPVVPPLESFLRHYNGLETVEPGAGARSRRARRLQTTPPVVQADALAARAAAGARPSPGGQFKRR